MNDKANFFMSVETKLFSPSPLTPGCYKRRIAFYKDEIVYTNKSFLYSSNNTQLLNKIDQIYDIESNATNLFMITEKGDVSIASDEKMVNSISNKCGFYSALELLGDKYIAAAHDITHSIRIIDPENFKTIGNMELPGIINSFEKVNSPSSNDLLCSVDDKTISLIDVREMKCIFRSSVIPQMPTSIFCTSGKIIVSCDDRKIRIFDQRKLKSPLITTKPATKNGAIALYSETGDEVVSIGCDESMTLAVINEDVGQFKRCKYLAESPWVSEPVMIGNKLSIVTRDGNLHQFTDPIAFLKTLNPTKADDVSE